MAIKISGSAIIDESRNLLAVNGANVSGALTATNIDATELRFSTGAEKLDIVSSGNVVDLTYNSSSANSAVVLAPSGNVTLNVTGIPETSDFDNHAINFVVFTRSTGTAYSCLTVTLNGHTAPIHWVSGDSSSAASGVTTTSGYSGYHFSGINTVGSASTCANYVVLGSISGGYF